MNMSQVWEEEEGLAVKLIMADEMLITVKRKIMVDDIRYDNTGVGRFIRGGGKIA